MRELPKVWENRAEILKVPAEDESVEQVSGNSH